MSLGTTLTSAPRPVRWTVGVLFTFGIALVGYFLTKLPGFSLIGQMACAILVAVTYRQLFGYPAPLRDGIQFSSKRLLRLAIILYGLKLNVHVILDDGLGLLVRDGLVITFAIFGVLLVAKLLKADTTISLLLGVGTGICGAAAIAAIAPIIKAKEEDTAISVGIIALMGTVFAVTYTVLRPFLPLDHIEYGMWAGMTLHEVAHVVLAGAPAGEDGLAFALLAKLGRVFLLVPVCLLFIAIMTKAKGSSDGSRNRIEFPWFLIGFILMSLVGTYVFGTVIPVSPGVLDFLSHLTTWLLTAAMVGLGLNVSLRDVKDRALRPLLAMTVVSIILSVVVYLVILY